MLHPYGMVNLSISLFILLIGGIGKGFKFMYENPIYFTIPILIIGIGFGIKSEVIPIKKISSDIENSITTNPQYIISIEIFKEIKQNEKINKGVIQLGATGNGILNRTHNFIESEEFQTVWNGDNSILKGKAIVARNEISNKGETTLQFIKSQYYLKFLFNNKSGAIGDFSAEDCFIEIEMNS